MQKNTLVVAAITRNINGVKAILPTSLTQIERDLVSYALNAYAFVMYPRTQFSFNDLADEIGRVYSLDNPRNTSIVDVLRKCHEKLISMQAKKEEVVQRIEPH